MKCKKIFINRPWVIELTHDDFNEKIDIPSEVIIRNHSSHISAGTELACITGIEEWFTIPDVPGYTSVGTIQESGDAVEELKKGDMVFTYGPHSEYFKINTVDRWHGVCVKVPQGLDPGIAAFTHMGIIAMTSLRVSNIQLGDFVGVSGMGTIGNLAAQFAKLQGATVIGTDINESRLEMAHKCGINFTINSAKEDIGDVVGRITGNRMVTTWIDATGLSEVVDEAMNYIAERGEMILLGTPRNPFESDLTPLLRKIHLLDGIDMKGALEFRFPTHNTDFEKHSIERNARIIMDLMKNGKLIIEPLYSHRLKPEEAAKAYTGLRDDPGKYIGVVFDWT